MLSSRARYATRALLELTIHYEDGPTQIQDISDRQNIPFKYLQQILMSLKVAGFVQSRKGPGGGYMLASPPQEISLAAVLRAMDGPLAPISCVSVMSFSECGCPRPETCSLRAAFRDVREAMVDVLDQTTFADLRDRQATAEANQSASFDFVI
jgi:Rrf2 family protein